MIAKDLANVPRRIFRDHENPGDWGQRATTLLTSHLSSTFTSVRRTR